MIWSAIATIDFRKTRVSLNGGVRTSRRISFSGSINYGDEIRYIDNPYLGPHDRLGGVRHAASDFAPRVRDHRGHESVHRSARCQRSLRHQNLRATTTYQFTDRLLLRNILETRFVGQEIRRERAGHVPCERRDGVLRRLRRSATARAARSTRRFSRERGTSAPTAQSSPSCSICSGIEISSISTAP